MITRKIKVFVDDRETTYVHTNDEILRYYLPKMRRNVIVLPLSKKYTIISSAKVFIEYLCYYAI